MKDTTLNIGYPEVFLVGKNGQGKTNFLEAVYLHSNARSFRPGDDRAIAKTGSKGYYSKITYEHAENILYSELIYDLPSNKKEIFINNSFKYWSFDLDWLSGR